MEENTICEICQGIYVFEEHMTRAYLVTGSSGNLLIDSGWAQFNYPEEIRKISDKPVTYVNTHSDNDHIGGSFYFRSQILIHPLEVEALQEKLGDGFCIEPCTDGQIFQLGGRTVTAILTPGHSPGSLSFLDSLTGALISGDTVSSEFVFMTGEQRKLDVLIDTLEKLKDCSEVRFLLPSHGPTPLDKAAIDTELMLARRAYSSVECDEIRFIPGLEIKNNMRREFMRTVHVYQYNGLELFV